ncbi:MAG: hypothetical protein LBS55_00520 [Prevotellaceae bacterium]|nr:hypothetical protein [Prevotellaceae bacterium]
MNRNRKGENKLALSLVICLMIMVFSCTDNDFDKDYTRVDAGLNVNADLTFDANAGGTKEVTFTQVPAGAVWGYRKSADWINVVQYNNKLEISVVLYEGITDKELKDREGTVTLIKEADGGSSVEAGVIKVKQTHGVPSGTNWDNGEVTPLSWDWNSKDSLVVDLDTQKWNETGLDGDNKKYYKYVYKIIGDKASSFEQTVNDSVRPSRIIKIAKKDDNKDRDAIKAYLIVTDKDGTTIHVRRELTIENRLGDFTLNDETEKKIVVSADKQDVEVEAIALKKASDTIVCKLIESENYDWIAVQEPLDPLKGGGKVKVTVNANTSTSDAREAKLELVNADGDASFDPPVYLYIKQNQKLVYDE